MRVIPHHNYNIVEWGSKLEQSQSNLLQQIDYNIVEWGSKLEQAC